MASCIKHAKGFFVLHMEKNIHINSLASHLNDVWQLSVLHQGFTRTKSGHNLYVRQPGSRTEGNHSITQLVWQSKGHCATRRPPASISYLSKLLSELWKMTFHTKRRPACDDPWSRATVSWHLEHVLTFASEQSSQSTRHSKICCSSTSCTRPTRLSGRLQPIIKNKTREWNYFVQRLAN
jgi:hypothetical protein